MDELSTADDAPPEEVTRPYSDIAAEEASYRYGDLYPHRTIIYPCPKCKIFRSMNEGEQCETCRRTAYRVFPQVSNASRQSVEDQHLERQSARLG